MVRANVNITTLREEQTAPWGFRRRWSDLLESMSWLPRALEEKEALELQTAKWKAARAAVKELREALLAQYRLNSVGTKGADETI
jgi:hypothetical protein